MDGWLLKLLYLLALISVLLFCALLFCLIYYLTNGEDGSSNTGAKALKVTKREQQVTERSRRGRGRSYPVWDDGSDMLAAASGKQTMCSTLTRSAKESDVILATAMSSIPLRQLGGNKNNITVDVSQQMYLNKEVESLEEHQCIVCRARKAIAWDKITCFAQTTISVLVYKRTPNSEPNALTSIQQDTKEPREGILTFGGRGTLEDTNRSDSILTIAPTPDSRLNYGSPGDRHRAGL